MGTFLGISTALILLGAGCYTAGVLTPTPPIILRFYEWTGLKKRAA